MQTNSARRKSPRQLVRRLQFEKLEDRRVMATILPMTAGNDASSSASLSADGRFVVFLSEATNLVPNQEDTIRFDTHFKDVFLYDSQTNETRLLSGSAGSATLTANSESTNAAISADGRFVAFTSYASDLVAGQDESEAAGNFGLVDLFLYDVQQRTTTLVSHVPGFPTKPVNYGVVDRRPSISADGRRIAFASQANDLVSGVTDDPSSSDVFLFERGDGQTPASMRIVTHALALPEFADGSGASEPVISADGEYVAFQSFAGSLVANQDERNGNADVFLYEVATDKIRLVSGAAGSETQTANAPSFQVSPIGVSAHGRYVVFRSFADDLVSGMVDDNHNSDVFLYDRDAATNRVTLVSHVPGDLLTAATGGSADSGDAVINVDLSHTEANRDGLFIAFTSTATNLVGGVTDNNNARDLFLYDAGTGNNTLVSHAAVSQPGDPLTTSNASVENGFQRGPVISGNGRYVAFATKATNVVAGQVDAAFATNDVFRYDRDTGMNTLLSGKRGSEQSTGNSVSDVQAISADGSTVAFSSHASDLIDGDSNGQRDLFFTISPLSLGFLGKLYDAVSASELNVQDGVSDGWFVVSLRSGLGAREVTSTELIRNDGVKWNTSGTGGASRLGLASSITSLSTSVNVVDGGQFMAVAADATGGSYFTAGHRFTLTATFADGSTTTAEFGPLPPMTLSFEGKARDRVGRSETALSADGRADGTFEVILPPATGRITSLDLDRGDGVRWNTTPNDQPFPLWVLGVATGYDEPLLNRSDGSLPTDGPSLVFPDGGRLVIFAPEDRPEADSFFVAGKTYHLTAGLADGSHIEASITLTDEDAPTPSKFQFRAESFVAGEKGGTARIRVDRSGGTNTTASVRYATANGTAIAGQDYVATSGVLTFAPGETNKSFTVQVELDGDEEGDETLTINLSDPSDNASLGTIRSTTLKIENATPVANVSLAVTADGIAQVGEEFTYTLTISNTGPDPAFDLLVLHPLDEGVTLRRVSGDGCVEVNRLVRCTSNRLGADTAQQVDVTVMPNAIVPSTSAPVTSFVIKAGASSDSRDDNLTNNNNTAEPKTIRVRPANDDFADRTVLVGSQGELHVPGSNVNATGEALNFSSRTDWKVYDPGTEPKSVWYEWTPTYAAGRVGRVHFSTASSSYDTLLAAYTRLRDNDVLVPVGESDDVSDSDRTSRLDFNVLGGRTYYIVVDGFHGADGAIELSWWEEPEIVAGAVDQVVEGLNPSEVNAGTGPEVIVVRGTGFTAESVVFVNGQQRSTAVLAEATGLALAVQLTSEDKAYPGVLQITVRTGDAVSGVDGRSLLLISNYTSIRVNAGETVAGSSRRLLSVTKPEPITRFVVSCPPGSNVCGVVPKVYSTPDNQFCDEASLCFETLRQFQIAHGFWCDDYLCERSLEEYQRKHGGQSPVDPVMPGVAVDSVAYSLQLEGTLRLGSVEFDPGTIIPEGAMLIGQDGASLIGQDGASLIERLQIAGLIGQDGASLIGQDGASLIGQDGASLIGQGGSTFTSGGFVNRVQGEALPPVQSWFEVTDGNGNPATFTTTTHADGTTTSSASLNFDGELTGRLTQLSAGMVFAIVIPDRLEFGSPTYAVAESSGSAVVTVKRTGTSVGRVTVQYATSDVSATAGADYTATTGELTFESGETSKTFSVPILTDTAADSGEQVRLTLRSPGGIARLGTQTTAVLTINAPLRPFHNARMPANVNDDQFISANDALLIIGELSTNGAHALSANVTGQINYYDVNDDNFVTANDALLVIGDLIANGARPVTSASPSAQAEPGSLPTEAVDAAFAEGTRDWHSPRAVPLVTRHDRSPSLVSRHDGLANETPTCLGNPRRPTAMAFARRATPAKAESLLEPNADDTLDESIWG